MADRRRLLLILSNGVLLALLIAVAIREDYPRRIAGWIQEEKPTGYQDNHHYQRQMDLYPYYEKKGRIVMLGNSLTKGVDWNELLNRDDVINRGIPSDVTEGLRSRLETVWAVDPQICFVLGGSVDLSRGITPVEVAGNVRAIAAALQQQQIRPVIQSIPFATAPFPDYELFNEAVTTTNELLAEFCRDQQIRYLDLNRVLGQNGQLKKEYTYDGIHLTGRGYQQWKELIAPVIRAELAKEPAVSRDS